MTQEEIMRSNGVEGMDSPYGNGVSKLQPDQAIFDQDTAMMPVTGREGIMQKVFLLETAINVWNEIFARYKENYDLFYSKQWTDDEVDLIRRQGREPLAFNKINPVIRNVLGRLVSTQQQWKIAPKVDPSMPNPKDPEKIRKAELLEKALNGIAYASGYSTQEEKLIEADGIIGGIGWAAIRINNLDDAYQELRLEWNDPNEIVYDPTCRKPDLSDARWLARRIYLTVPEALEAFPDAQDIVRNWSRSTDPYFALWNTEWFDTGNSINYDQFLIPIIEFYERRRFTVFVLTDLNSDEGIKTEFATMEDAEAELQRRSAQYQQQAMMEMVQGLPEVPFAPLTIVPKTVNRIVETCFLQLEMLDEKVLDQDWYPYVPFFPHFTRGRFQSVVEMMKDTQKAFNRWITSVDYVIAVAAKAGIAYDQTRFAPGWTPQQVSEEYSRHGAMIPVQGDPKTAFAPLESNISITGAYADLLAQAERQNNLLFPQPAFSSPMPGVGGGAPDQSGVALKEQKTAADMGTELWFDNFLQYRRRLGECAIEAIQKWSDKPMLVQWMGVDGAAQYQTLNSDINSEDSIYGERFMVAVTDTDYSPTLRMQAVMEATILSQSPIAAINPMFALECEKIKIESGNIPESMKQRLLATLNAPPPPMNGAAGGPAQPSGSPPVSPSPAPPMAG
ncbi:MAG: hypothetical protein KGJ13_02120 [Patescibacteria group bacterium]|nr:hypothetical protein [Patescibacteria group bacterium]